VGAALVVMVAAVAAVAGSEPAAPARSWRAVSATSTSPVWRHALQGASAQPSAPRGQLELWWSLDPGSDTSVSAVTVWVGLAGAGLGPERNDGWRFVPPAHRAVLRPGDPAVAVASGALVAGRYNHVFVAADRAIAATPAGREDLTVHVEPIARPFGLAAGTTAVLEIVLVALRKPSTGTLQLFVKDALIRSN
jgi:hypothetical protein